jgi:signal peptidase I
MSRSRRTAVIALGAMCAVSSFGWMLTAFMFSAYKIPSEAMTPNVAPGDRVLARHIGGHEARRGNIVVFRSRLSTPSNDPFGNPTTPDIYQGLRISRVIALGGDRIDGVDGRVRVNGRTLSEPYLAHGMTTDRLRPLVVPPGMAYLMGDNRINARDSRIDGPVAATNIVGRVDYINLPLDWIALGVAVLSGIAFTWLLVASEVRRRRVNRALQTHASWDAAP